MANEINLRIDTAIDKIVELCPDGPPKVIFCTAAGGFKDSVKKANVKLDDQFTVDKPQWVKDAESRAEELAKLLMDFEVATIEELKSKFGSLPGSNSGSGNGSPDTLPGGDPLTPLRRIAEAIDEAANSLDRQSLMICSGTVEVSLKVDVGGAAAETKLKLDIQPRPLQ